MKANPVPMAEILAWLARTHPALHQTAEAERDWLWLTADLRGEQNKAIRESIKQAGFRFARHGHDLPSGKLAHWAHSCTRPIGFKRKPGKSNQAATPSKQSQAQRPDPLTEASWEDDGLEQLAAAFV